MNHYIYDEITEKMRPMTEAEYAEFQKNLAEYLSSSNPE
jgi:hypothetical protein